jgi:signal transduction histidine kinase
MRRLGLQGQLALAVLAVLGVLLFVTAALLLWRAESALFLAFQQRHQAATRQLAKAVRYGVLTESEALLAPELDAFAETPDLVEVTLFNDAGVALASRRGSATGQLRTTLREIVQQSSERTATHLAGFDLPDAPKHSLGQVVAVFSADATAPVRHRLRFEIIAAFCAVGLLGLGGILALANRAVRRVRALSQGAHKVAAGDFAVELDAVGQDELCDLCRSFNQMAQALLAQRRELERTAAQLAEREALATLGRATAVIAHELKNPMGILLGAAEVVSNPRRTEQQRAQAARLIAAEVKRLELTLAQLLAYGRPQEPKREAIDLRALCEETALRSRFDDEALLVRCDGPSAPVCVDSFQVQQLLLNLCLNARQAGATEVALTIEPRGDRTWLHISDNGGGVAPAVADSLFRPFVTTKQRGTGLGLAVARRIAREHEGDLRLLPCDLGAHFVLELPLTNVTEGNP